MTNRPTSGHAATVTVCLALLVCGGIVVSDAIKPFSDSSNPIQTSATPAVTHVSMTADSDATNRQRSAGTSVARVSPSTLRLHQQTTHQQTTHQSAAATTIEPTHPESSTVSPNLNSPETGNKTGPDAPSDDDHTEDATEPNGPSQPVTPRTTDAGTPIDTAETASSDINPSNVDSPSSAAESIGDQAINPEASDEAIDVQSDPSSDDDTISPLSLPVETQAPVFDPPASDPPASDFPAEASNDALTENLIEEPSSAEELSANAKEDEVRPANVFTIRNDTRWSSMFIRYDQNFVRIYAGQTIQREGLDVWPTNLLIGNQHRGKTITLVPGNYHIVAEGNQFHIRPIDQ